MRIIGGKLGGRKIKPPANMPNTRPTTDVAREGLFNILENNLDISALSTLDLFGGTGSISYELASRGAKELVVVEKDPKMHEFISSIVQQLNLDNIKVLKIDVFRFIEVATQQFDLIFAGPPYALTTIDELPSRIFEKRLLTHKGWFILEHTPRNDYSAFPFFKTQRNYGTTVFSIFIENRA